MHVTGGRRCFICTTCRLANPRQRTFAWWLDIRIRKELAANFSNSIMFLDYNENIFDSFVYLEKNWQREQRLGAFVTRGVCENGHRDGRQMHAGTRLTIASV